MHVAVGGRPPSLLGADSVADPLAASQYGSGMPDLSSDGGERQEPAAEAASDGIDWQDVLDADTRGAGELLQR